MRTALKAISGLMLLIALTLFLPVFAQDSATCNVSAGQNVNRRNGPGTSFNVISVLPANQGTSVVGQTTGTDGVVCWQLIDGTWVRSDTVAETGDCESLPDPFAPPTETPTPSPTAAETPIPELTRNNDDLAYSVGDEVTVFGSSAVFLIYAESSIDASVVEAQSVGLF